MSNPISDGKVPIVETLIDETEPTSTVVVKATAAASNTPVDEFPPLQYSVDTDALNAIFDNGATRGYLSIRYYGYIVCVHADDVVTVHEPI